MRRLVLTVVLATLSFGASAQQYPARPIHLAATFAAGGAMDLTARSMAAVNGAVQPLPKVGMA